MTTNPYQPVDDDDCEPLPSADTLSEMLIGSFGPVVAIATVGLLTMLVVYVAELLGL